MRPQHVPTPLLALALAGTYLSGTASTPGTDAAAALRALAATVTLVEQRGSDTAPAGESIMLALL